MQVKEAINAYESDPIRSGRVSRPRLERAQRVSGDASGGG
jgi:hypothetical protein